MTRTTGVLDDDRVEPFRSMLTWLAGKSDGTLGTDFPLLVVAEGLLRALAATAIARAASRAAVLLTIEDVLWADRETAAIIEYLADHLSGQPVAVMATLRSEPSAGADMVKRLAARRSADVVEVTLEPARSSRAGVGLPRRKRRVGRVGGGADDRSDGVCSSSTSGWPPLRPPACLSSAVAA